MKDTLKRFDIRRAPPDQATVDAWLEASRSALKVFRRRMRWIAAAEVTAMACAYAGGIWLAGSIGSIGLGLLIVGIGPTVAIIAVTLTSSVRKSELKNIIRCLMPSADPDAIASLRGLSQEVDSYLDQLDQLGRKITGAEVRVLSKEPRRSFARA